MNLKCFAAIKNVPVGLHWKKNDYDLDWFSIEHSTSLRNKLLFILQDMLIWISQMEITVAQTLKAFVNLKCIIEVRQNIIHCNYKTHRLKTTHETWDMSVDILIIIRLDCVSELLGANIVWCYKVFTLFMSSGQSIWRNIIHKILHTIDFIYNDNHYSVESQIVRMRLMPMWRIGLLTKR